jgi:DUF2075 family protein
MLIYESTKEKFLESVFNDTIVDKIYDSYLQKIGHTKKSEIHSWNNSMQFMYKVLDTNDIPNNCGIAIEFKIPFTNKRVDFLISGKNKDDLSSVIIVELKQWDTVQKVDGKDGIIKTFLGKGLNDTTHPSYQAWSYYNLLKHFNENIQKDNINLYPCAYLHNLDLNKNKDINDKIYSYYINKAPLFLKGDIIKLREFINQFIKYGDNKELLYKIESGKLKPSKFLQDNLVNLLNGNPEFTLIDDQKIAYEQIFFSANKSKKDNKKRVVIVRGGPGTGKSVIAINLLVNLTKESLVVHYVSKNAAPRNVYSSLLKKTFTKNHIDNLFKGSGSYNSTPKNLLDVLIVDEAHRLNEKSGLFKNKGENQIKEIIYSSKCSVFFIDENQRVDISDIGNESEIVKFAKFYNAEIYINDLQSQFRCGGSDGYISWIDDVLDIKETANFDGFDNQYDLKIFDNPNDLKEEIFKKNKLNNKARILAGYCWDWNKKGRANTKDYDIVIPEHNFEMSWNLDNTSTWAIDKESVNEIGCIHTSQGLEFDYVGVIIGNDLRYENNKIVTDFTKRAKTDQSLKGINKLNISNPIDAHRISDQIIKNTYRTLLTRGQKGCYIYCTDKNLSNYLKERIESLLKY